MSEININEPRKCRKCKQIKLVKDFERYVAIKSGNRKIEYYRRTCKKCRSFRRNERYETIPSERQKRKAINQRRFRENKASSLKLRYGVSLEWFDAKKIEQDNKCAICHKENLSHNGRELSIDHNHVTGEVRALLCSKCNLILGEVNDSVPKLTAMIDYLNKYDTTEHDFII
jgi:hypothetical protein